MTHSPEFQQHQARGFDGTTLAKATWQLDELAATLACGKTRRARGRVEAEIAKITHDEWVRRVITWELTGDTPPRPAAGLVHRRRRRRPGRGDLR